MKNTTVKGLLLVGIITAMFACETKKEEAAAVVIDKEQIKKEIQAKEDEFAATYNAGVLKDIGYYADDATTFLQNRPALVGKDAIVEFLNQIYHRIPIKSHLKQERFLYQMMATWL